MSKVAAPLHRFTITRSSKGWTVQEGGEKHGPYLSRRDALSDAIDAARAASNGGDQAEVVDLSGKQQEVVLWRSGADRDREP